jgi:CDP-glycerol glycerophosphotransferase
MNHAAAQFAHVEQLAQLAEKTHRKSRLAVFIGRDGGRFMDNVKYAFLHCVKHVPELTCFFLSTHQDEVRTLREHDLPAVLHTDEGSIEMLLRAGIVVSDDFWWKENAVMWAALHPAKSMQLWHGIPLKAIGRPEYESTVNMDPAKADRLRFCYSGYDAVLSTSPFFTETAFARAFAAKEFPELGYPRNDALLRRHDRLDMINVDGPLYAEMARGKKTGRRTVVYMPTFRDLGNTPFADGAVDVVRLDAFAREHDLLFVLKLHPYLAETLQRLPDRVRLASSKSDPYPLLAHADLLVTDYSSISFDFLLTGRPMLFYPYDFEDYVTRNRELLYDYAAMTPGPRPRTPDAFFAAIQSLLVEGKDEWIQDRARLLALSFAQPDGRAALRLGSYLAGRLLGRAAAGVTRP